jgi:hypothetical protein
MCYSCQSINSKQTTPSETVDTSIATTENYNKNRGSRGGPAGGGGAGGGRGRGVWPLVIGTLYFAVQWFAVSSAASFLADKDFIFTESAE